MEKRIQEQAEEQKETKEAGMMGEMKEWMRKRKMYEIFVEQKMEAQQEDRVRKLLDVDSKSSRDPSHSDRNRKRFVVPSRDRMALPTFQLQVVGMKSIGKKKVYDLEVEAPMNSFVAGSVIVHNCITRWLRTRSTCPLDDEEWTLCSINNKKTKWKGTERKGKAKGKGKEDGEGIQDQSYQT